MTSMRKEANTLAGRNRREALKTFGRYAAVAPTAMVMLTPREGHAGKGKGKGKAWGKGGKRKGGNSHY